ncbi:MAG: Eco57I restriction-modification methylase domain-containing protein, partial [Methanosarcinales archaeon]
MVLEFETLIQRYEYYKKSDSYLNISIESTYKEFIEPFLEFFNWKPQDFQALDKLEIFTFKDDIIAYKDNKPVFFVGILKPDYSNLEKLETKIDANQCLGILTNFEKTYIYDSLKASEIGIEVSTLIAEYGIKDYKDKLEELRVILNKDSVLSGAYKNKVLELQKREFDAEFLKKLREIREALAYSIIKNPNNLKLFKKDKGIEEEGFNFAIQRIIDRLMMLRFMEDLGLSASNKLSKIYYNQKKGYWKAVKAYFKEFRERYDGRIFDFGVVDELELKELEFKAILEEFATRIFGEKRLNLLGSTYEKYLGSTINIENGEIKVIARPDVRKAEGAYYTPEYITKYITDNTIGKILDAYRSELEATLKKGDYNKFIEIYQKCKDLKVLDPACGSGSFLVQVLFRFKDFYKSYNILREELKKKCKIEDFDSVVPKVERCGLFALKNNIYGVDYDIRASEVTAFNLMMHVAEDLKKDGVKFPPILEENLKTGNSLISGIADRKELEKYKDKIALLIKLRKNARENEKEIKRISKPINDALNQKLEQYFGEAYKKDWKIRPFNWELEFPEVFFKEDGSLKENAGFDVVLGNPPWISFGLRGTEKLPQDLQEYLRLTYPNSMEYKGSIYAIFMNLGISLLKYGGRFSFILPDSFLLGRYFSRLRRYILNTCNIKEITLILRDFWPDGSVGRSVIINLQKENKELESRNNKLKAVLYEEVEDIIEKGYISSYSYEQNYFESIVYNRFRLFFEEKSKKLIEIIESKGKIPLTNLVELYSGCIGRYGQQSIVSFHKKESLIIKNRHGDVVYQDNNAKDKWRPLLESGADIERYLISYKGKNIYFEPDESRRRIYAKSGFNEEKYIKEKLFLRQTGDSLISAYDDQGLFCLNNMHLLNLRDKDSNINLKYILALLNSKLLNHYYHLISIEFGRAMAQTDIETIEQLPIYPATPDQQKPIIEL